MKVVHLFTSVDDVGDGFGSATVREVIVDRRGERVLSQRSLSHDTYVTPRPFDAVRDRVSGAYVAAAVLAFHDSTATRRRYFVVDSAAVSKLRGADPATVRELRAGLGDAGTVGVVQTVRRCARARDCVRIVVDEYQPWDRGAGIGVTMRSSDGRCAYLTRYLSVRRRPDGVVWTTEEFSAKGDCAAPAEHSTAPRRLR